MEALVIFKEIFPELCKDIIGVLLINNDVLDLTLKDGQHSLIFVCRGVDDWSLTAYPLDREE